MNKWISRTLQLYPKPLNTGVNRTEARKFPAGLVFACQEEKITETSDIYDVMEDECCTDHFQPMEMSHCRDIIFFVYGVSLIVFER